MLTECPNSGSEIGFISIFELSHSSHWHRREAPLCECVCVKEKAEIALR